MQKLIITIALASTIGLAYYVVECIDAANNLVQQAYRIQP